MNFQELYPLNSVKIKISTAMTEHYLDRLARTISENWDQPALTDFYLTADGTAQDTTRGNHYTYGEMYLAMLRLGKMMNALGIKSGDHIAICGANSANWAVAYLAIAAYRGVAVTVLHTQATEDIARQINFSDAVALFTDSSLWSQLKQQNMPQVKHVILLDDLKPLETIAGIEPVDEKPTLPITIPHGAMDDLAMICFTSGSTGTPKGVMLSYSNLSATISSVSSVYRKANNRKMLLYLSMAHILSTIGELLSNINQGCEIYIYVNNLSLECLLKSINIIKPFEFVAPPLIVEHFLLEKHLELLKTIILLLEGQYCQII